MGRGFRLLAAALVSTVVAALVPPAALAGAAGTAPRLNWTPCAEDRTAQCATMRVPLDWSRPRGATISLALVRRPATDPASRIGSLFVNPGGPGGSARSYVLNGANRFSRAIRARFDLVGMDPRGVGGSTPVLCSKAVVDAAPSGLPASQSEYDRWLAYNQRLHADCRRHTGPLIDHVDMLSVVRDMDAARAAVGDAALTYYGTSYGSLDGQQYAEVFPGRVRAIVADSNMDHSLDTWGFLASQAAAAQDSFDEFVAWNARTPDSPLHGRDVRALLATLRERAVQGRLLSPYQPGKAVSLDDLLSEVFVELYGPSWAYLAQVLADLDTGAPPAAGAAGRRWGCSAPPQPGSACASPRVPVPRVAATADLVAYPELAIFCSDWRLPLGGYPGYSAQLRWLAAIAPDMRYSPAAVPLALGCQPATGRVANPQHRLRVTHPATPLLLLNSLHDPATGYSWATGAARQLGRAGVLLTYDGWGHVVLSHSSCAAEAVERYLLTRQLPAPGTHCPAPAPEPEPEPEVVPDLAQPVPEGVPPAVGRMPY